MLFRYKNPKWIIKSWESFSRDQKIYSILTQLYLKMYNGSEINLENFLKDKNYFINKWDKDECNRLMKIWWKLPGDLRKDRIKIGMIYLAINAYLNKNKNSSYENILNYGESLIGVEKSNAFTPEFLEELRIYKLKENLNWVNLKKIQHLKNNPLNVLKMIVLHNKHVFPDGLFLSRSEFNLSMFPTESIRSFDEAAVLWDILNFGQLSNSTEYLRKNYFSSLTIDYKKQNIIDQIIHVFKTPNLFGIDIYFDGFAFQNFSGKSFDDLMNLSEIKAILFSFNSSQKRIYLEAALEQMGENVQYPIGSVWNSLASCVRKIFQYSYHSVASVFISKQELMEQFTLLEKEWEQLKNYPINPRILVAMHLARSNGITINNSTWLERIQFLLNYFKSKFIEALEFEELGEPILYFDRRKSTFLILKQLGLSDEEIKRKRHYKLYKNDINYIESDAIDEFLKIDKANRLDYNIINLIHTLSDLITPHSEIPLLFSYQGKTVNPMMELDKVEIDFKNQLLEYPRLLERVKKNLECQEVESTNENIQEEIKKLIDQIYSENKFQSNLDRYYEWINWIPAMGMLNNISDFVKDKDGNKFLLGKLVLSLDAIGFYSVINTAYHEINDFLLSNSEKIVIYSLRALLQDKLNLTKIKEIDWIKKNSFFSFCFSEIFENNEKPIKIFSKIRKNKISKENQRKKYPLIYLTDIHQVVPIKLQGNYYRQLDWLGKELHSRPLIYRNGSLGNYIFDDFLNKAIGISPFFPLDASSLKKLYTIREIGNLLTGIRNFSLCYDPREKFQKYFEIYGIEKFNVIDFYQDAYIKSPIFRGFFNFFINFIEKYELKETNTYKISVEESYISIGGNLLWKDESKIVVNDSRISSGNFNDFFNNRYLGSDYIDEINYTGFIPQIEHIAIHELLRFLTGKYDLFLARMEIIDRLVKEIEINFNKSSCEINESSLFKEKFKFFEKRFFEEVEKVAKKEQGAILWLTDKIFSEVSPKVLISPAYLRYAAFDDKEIVDVEQLKFQLSDVTNYLDKKLNDYMKLKVVEFIAGQHVAERETVRKVKLLFENLYSITNLPLENFDEEFSKYFTTNNVSLKDFLKVAYKRSDIFRKIFNYFSLTRKFVEKNSTLIAELKIIDPEVSIEIASIEDSMIYFLDDDIRYLTKKGLIPIEKERWLIHATLEKMLGLNVYELTEKAYELIREQNLEELKKLIAQRGEIHQLTDQILREIGIDFPKCLSGVFLICDDKILMQTLLRQKIQINRIITAEDIYIQKNILPQNTLKVDKNETLYSVSTLTEAHPTNTSFQKTLRRSRRDRPSLALNFQPNQTMSVSDKKIEGEVLNSRLNSWKEGYSGTRYLFEGSSNTINHWLLLLNVIIKKYSRKTYPQSVGLFSLDYIYQEKLGHIETLFIKTLKKASVAYGNRRYKHNKWYG